jgi:hypothetical protein
MTSTAAASPRQFRAIVFKRVPSTSDFSRSERLVLPGQHTADGARAALATAFRADGERLLVGGEVVPV